jgi:hypothetical protein
MTNLNISDHALDLLDLARAQYLENPLSESTDLVSQTMDKLENVLNAIKDEYSAWAEAAAAAE